MKRKNIGIWISNQLEPLIKRIIKKKTILIQFDLFLRIYVK